MTSNPALRFPMAELPKVCPGETCHARSGLFAHDDTGSEGDGDVDRICLLGDLPKFCSSRSPVEVDILACYGAAASMPSEGNESG